MAAASSSANYYQIGGRIHVAMILITIFLLISLPSKPVGLGFPSYESSENEKEKLVGSRPPGCINKCLNCKPCMATLVVQPHQRQWNNNNKRFYKTTSSSPREEGDTYYLLSWKCKCGSKLFQP
ncbi:hypothetical protein ACOSP7_008147 [Xanthoceras sorbifolium]